MVEKNIIQSHSQWFRMKKRIDFKNFFLSIQVEEYSERDMWLMRFCQRKTMCQLLFSFVDDTDNFLYEREWRKKWTHFY